MEYMMLSRFFALFVLFLALTTCSYAQTSSGDGDEGSGDCAEDKCGMNEECPESCSCTSGNLTLNRYCAEPCNNQYPWCARGSMCEVSEKTYICKCIPGYYIVAGGTCEQGKYFGGNITFTDTYDGNFDETEKKVRKVLNEIYGTSPYYVESIILSLENGSTIATYQMVYQDNTNVTKQYVERIFDSPSGCGGDDDDAGVLDLHINCNDSRKTVVLSDVLCKNKNSSLSRGCDLDTAICNTDDNGNFFCSCEVNYAKASADSLSCLKIKCMVDSECGPFGGVCDKYDETDQLDNMCSCFFGFTGDQCQEPWEFVFTIVTAVLGLLLTSVIVAWICKSKKTKTTAKSTKQEDMDLQTPFVDFQPGLVRAKVPSNMYSVSDSYEATNGGQSHTNEAYDGAYDELNRK